MSPQRVAHAHPPQTERGSVAAARTVHLLIVVVVVVVVAGSLGRCRSRSASLTATGDASRRHVWRSDGRGELGYDEEWRPSRATKFGNLSVTGLTDPG